MKHALVIEDNKDNIVLITKILEYAGFQTSRAVTGEQGFELAMQTSPDFILLDINLPGIKGDEVLKKIRQTASIAKIPVIAVTSEAMSGDKARLMALGFNGYIEKPIDPGEFISQVESVVQ